MFGLDIFAKFTKFKENVKKPEKLHSNKVISFNI